METVLAVVVAAAVALGGAPVRVGVPDGGGGRAPRHPAGRRVRPRLNRKVGPGPGGRGTARSRSHLWYVALEVLKAGTLIALGACLLTA